MISDEEYKKLIEKLQFYNSTRNTLLAFSFTTVLAAMGIIIGTEDTTISYWACVIPYFLILPFAARIAYYRLSAAHILSFLKIFAKDRMTFENGAKKVPESSIGIPYRIIAWLVNHEMFFLAVAVLVVFIQQFLTQSTLQSWQSLWPCLIPTGFTVAVFYVSNSVYSFKKLNANYSNEWENHLKDFPFDSDQKNI